MTVFNVLLVVASFSTGALGDRYLLGWGAPDAVAFRPREIHRGRYAHINPLLECEVAEASFTFLRPFKHRVEDLVEKLIREGRATTIAVYYRDLNNGPWFGIGEHEKFSPASLMKVPLMVAYLKRAETDPELLRRTMTFDGPRGFGELQNLRPAKTLVVGSAYTIDDLIMRMMAYSDNNAWELLFRNVGAKTLDGILADMNVDFDPDKAEDFMTVKANASFFRVLYNATYLNREMSEKALVYLSYPDFADGFLAGVPRGVTVASKFGERTLGPKREIKQLHEFGIVYHSPQPYLLGVMTRGGDFKALSGVLREISKLIYDEIDAQTRAPGKRPE